MVTLPRHLEEHILHLANMLPISYRLRNDVKPKPVRIPDIEPCKATLLMQASMMQLVEKGWMAPLDGGDEVQDLVVATVGVNHVQWFFRSVIYNDDWLEVEGPALWELVACHADIHADTNSL